MILLAKQDHGSTMHGNFTMITQRTQLAQFALLAVRVSIAVFTM